MGSPGSNPRPLTDDRERVLGETDIVALIGDHVTLRPKGREYVGLCPFHNDHKPSMGVVPHKQIFHCFSCGSGGNALDFVIKYHGMSFIEALKYLAERAGIELTPRTRTQRNDNDFEDAGADREQIAAANAFALDFFRTILNHQQHGTTAREIVARRGIAVEMVESFKVGAAPDRWDGLLKTIEAKGLPLDGFVAAGLLKRRDNGDGFYDALRNRLIFPILDQAGRPIGFGGRKINEADEPKYLNSPETALFHKGSTLFALPQAWRAIQASRVAVITEGYTDAIACHQAGVANVVATLGTALTNKHATLLKRICDSVALLFDGDEAGVRAADRAFDVLFPVGIDAKVVVLPDELDPDELLKEENGAERFRDALARGVDLLEFRFLRLKERLEKAGHDVGSQARAKAIEEELRHLVDLGLNAMSPIRRQTVIRKLARIADLDEVTIAKSVPSGGPRPTAESREASAETAVQRGPSGALEHAMACVLAAPVLLENFPQESQDILQAAAYSSAPIGQLASALATLDGSAGTGMLINQLENSESRRLAASFVAEIDRVTEGNDERISNYFIDCVNRVRMERHRGDEVEMKLDPVATLSRKIEATREKHAKLGGNPLALPRPS